VSTSPVSVVIVSWNTRDLLRQCLCSLERARNHLVEQLEIVVVDNASSDGTVGMLSSEFADVRCIANASNRGFAAATNQGIAATAGRYVVLVNPDTDFTETALAELLRFADTHPAAGALGPRLIHEDGRLQVSCFRLPTIGREFWRLFHLDRILPLDAYPMQRWSMQEPRRVEALQGACLLVRRDVLERIGPLDERFYMYTEEIDLCRRIIAAGWVVYWVPRSQVVHYGGQSTRQAARRMFIELYRSKIHYFRKHSGSVGCWLYKVLLFGAIVPRLIVPSMVAIVRPAARDELHSIVHNYRALLFALPSL